MAELIIENEQDKEQVTEELTSAMKSVCEAVMEMEECSFDAEISITLVDNEAIREINFEQRGIDNATDDLTNENGTGNNR